MIYNGTEFADTLAVQNEDEVIAYGYGGDDYFEILNTGGGTGNVEVYGGSGWDGTFIDGAGNVFVDGGADADGVTLQHVINAKVWGGDGMDGLTVRGADSAILRGGAGNDGLLVWGVTDAKLLGGAGNDFLTVESSSGVMKGGKGDDAYNLTMYESPTVLIKENASEGYDSIDMVRYAGQASYFHIPTNVEQLYLRGANDGVLITLAGNASDNKIVSMSGLLLDVQGGEGNDWIECDAATGSVVSGGQGDDLIDASGAEVHGGSGADTFRIRGGDYHINDYNGNVDRIELSNWNSSRGLDLGALAAEAFRAGSHATDASDRVIWDATTGNLYYDSDGSGVTAQALVGHITLIGGQLDHNDFTVT